MSKIVGKIKGGGFHRIGRYIPKKYLVEHYYSKWSGGRKINLKNPERFSDKLGWYKLYYRDELMRTCTDKASVREYIASCGYGDLLNECYGVYDRVEDIDWDALPKQFVLKDTLGGSSRSVKLVFDKDTLDIEETKKTLQTWIDKRKGYVSLAGEWVYEERPTRIIVEKLLISDPNDDLPDYKLFCFNGKMFCSYLMRKGRHCDGDQAFAMNYHVGENAFLDRDYKLLNVWRTDFDRITEQPEKPKNYEKMVEIAEKLSQPFPHVRVDFYNIDGRIIFGELTFFTNAGYIPFDPDSFDYEMGKAFVLPKRNH